MLIKILHKSVKKDLEYLINKELSGEQLTDKQLDKKEELKKLLKMLEDFNEDWKNLNIFKLIQLKIEVSDKNTGYEVHNKTINITPILFLIIFLIIIMILY